MLGGDLLTEIALKSVSLHDPSPPIQPVYCVKRSADTGIKATASYHKYQQLQVLREVKECVCRANMYTPQTEHAQLVQKRPAGLPRGLAPGPPGASEGAGRTC